jgi:hypothetical protein
MDLPSLLPGGVEAPNTLTSSSSMNQSSNLTSPYSVHPNHYLQPLGQSEPLCNTTTDSLTAQLAQTLQKQDLTIAGLKIPSHVYCCGFYELVFSITYGKFLVGLAKLNPKSLTRAAAEEAWWTITQQKFKEWEPNPEVYDQEKKRLARKIAASQVRLL